MKNNFDKIENWLKENAERIAEFSLQQSATENELHELEKTIGRALPNDFKELYLWHNGLNDDENLGSFFYGMDFLPIEKVISEYLETKENFSSENLPLEKADKEINPLNMYNPDWLQFAFDCAHSGLYLDFAPTNDGKFGQIIFIDNEYEIGILVANSTSELVENFANDLENNLYYLEQDALEDGNHFLETAEEIDIVNWQNSEKWKR